MKKRVVAVSLLICTTAPSYAIPLVVSIITCLVGKHGIHSSN